MEHESFEDEAIAAEMNKNYICIKVDREERPDVDGYYMDACQIMSGRGGWPLNAFTLPDGRPVYVGTYFPKNSWKGLLHELAHGYKFKPQKYIEYADKLIEGIKGLSIQPVSISEEAKINLDIAYISQSILQYFDIENGGRGRAPKFPMPNIWTFLYHSGLLYEGLEGIDASTLTLKKMAIGGIYDQIGGGFSRYSTDEEWKVPHFEKMLYDNAQLIGLYALGYRISHLERFREVCEQTVQFLWNELSNKNGGYYTALDADSEGIEGKYYVWTEEEINQLFLDNEQDASICKEYFGINKEGFWEKDWSILIEASSIEKLSDEYGLSDDELQKNISSIKSKLLIERKKRIAPGLDNKIMLSNNALLISGLCLCNQYLDNNDYLQKALEIKKYLQKNHIVNDSELIRIHQNNNKYINGFLEDYAYYIKALIDLYQNTGEESIIIEAKKWLDITIQHFYDENSGLFYFSKKGTESNIHNKIDTSDNVTPSPNAVMSENLLLIGKIFSEDNYILMFEKMIHTMQSNIVEYSAYHTYWANVIMMYQYGIKEVMVVYKDTLPTLHLRGNVLPFVIWMYKKEGSETTIPQLNDKKLIDDSNLTYYVCKNKVCQLPITDLTISDLI
jgi:uncharacterized protein YyaL (SSP411 family)